MSTTFRGFRRSDGAVGVRNHVVVLSTVALTNRLAALIAEAHADALCVSGDFMRGLRGPDPDVQQRVLDGVVHHPNVGGALILAHDANAAEAIRERYQSVDKPLEVHAFMAANGIGDAVDRGRGALRAIARQLSAQRRQAAPLGGLTVALECGGSDATSGLCANPTIGRFVDRLIDEGGTAIVSETAEFIGAEHVIRERAVSEVVAGRILERMAAREAYMCADGTDYRGVNPTAENIAAGLTTLVEKSMGAVAKTGTTPFCGCLDFAERPDGPGLYFMDTPFFSPMSITGMVAAGAQLTLFGIGVFNPSGNPLAPTLKVCGNPQTVDVWRDGVDLDVSGLVTGARDLSDTAEALGGMVLQVIEGAATKTERWGEGQFMAPKTVPPL
ncbi:MAG: UxaA family hydrolase [Gammaproteobacteria bacterium]